LKHIYLFLITLVQFFLLYYQLRRVPAGNTVVYTVPWTCTPWSRRLKGVQVQGTVYTTVLPRLEPAVTFLSFTCLTWEIITE